MSSRRSVRQLLVAVLLGVLVGGGLMAVTPAGAEVSNAVATNWKKIWKKNLKPLADKRYYTKAQTDVKYSTKAETAAGDAASNAATDSKLTGYYKKAEVDARSYTKAESDAKYAPTPTVIRGTFINVLNSGTFLSEPISWGVNFATAPTVNIIQPGGVAPAGCAGGTVAAPSAQPGNFCLFLRFNSSDSLAANTATLGAGASPFGVLLLANRGAAGYLEISGSWAVRPGPTGISSRGSTDAGTRAPATSVN